MVYINNEMITNALNGMPVHEIINAVWEESSPYFQRSVTQATMGNIRNTGDGINANPALQNEFLNLLIVNAIPIAFSSPNLRNDFKWAQGETIPYGKTLQETATDVIEPLQFDMYNAEFKSKEIFVPKVLTRFYVKNREEQYPLTVSKQQLMTAFENDASFMRFFSSLLNTLNDSNERSEYKYTVGLIEEYYLKNKFFVVEAPNVLSGTAQDAEHFIEVINTHAMTMSLGVGTRIYNNQGLVTRTDMSRLHLFITPAMLSRLKLGVWAKAFNLSEAEFKPNIHLIDKFGDSPEIQAVLVDEEWFRIHPNYREMSKDENGRGLYTNYWWNCWDTFAASDFKNAVVIIDKDLDVPVYDVIIPMATVDGRRGAEIPYDYIIRQTDDVVYTPVFKVIAPDGGVTLDSQTKFTGNVLKISPNEKNTTLQITATVTHTTGTGETKVDTLVVGRAMVKVVK